MFERFTERARQVVIDSQEAARDLKHNYIGSEHVLLGLMKSDGIAPEVLNSLDIHDEDVEKAIAQIVGVGDEANMSVDRLPFTPRAKKVLELALREALSLGHNYIGTEHILLGLVREADDGSSEGVAARILNDSGVTADMVRNEVIRLLSLPSSERPPVVQESITQRKVDELEKCLHRAFKLLNDIRSEIVEGEQ